MYLRPKHTRILNEAAGADGAGAGTGGGAADTGAGAATGAPAGTSVLAQGAGAGAGAGAGGDTDWLPEKYRVAGEDGALDLAASSRKLAEGYGSLSKRFGAGDVPPQDVAGYKVNIPEAHAESLKGWDFAKDEKLQGFLGEAHKVGFTQSQLDVVMSTYAGMAAGASQAQTPEALAEKCVSELGQVWKDPGEFDKRIGPAYKAAEKVAGSMGLKFDDFQAAGLDNNPMFIRVMDHLAKEMGEDTPQGTQQAGANGLDFEAQAAALRAEKNALPEKDPRRQQIQDKLNDMYNRRYPEGKS